MRRLRGGIRGRPAFMLGWINASMGDRAYGKASGMFGVSTNNASNGLYKIAEYYTLSDLAAV